MSSAQTDHLSRFINSDTFTAEGHEWEMGWMNEHVPLVWKIDSGGTDLWKEVYNNTKSRLKVVAWEQMVELGGKYILHVNRVILVIAAVISQTKRFFFLSFFHIQFVGESKAYGVSSDQVFSLWFSKKTEWVEFASPELKGICSNTIYVGSWQIVKKCFI